MLEGLIELKDIQPSWDLFIILFFVISSLVYGISLGRDRILIILVSIYMSLAVVKYMPFITEFNADVSINSQFAFKVSVFLGIFVILFFFLSQSALLKTFASSAEQGTWWEVMIFSFLHVGLLVSVTLSFFPTDASEFISPLTKALFISDAAKSVWIMLPIITMVMFGRRSSR